MLDASTGPNVMLRALELCVGAGGLALAAGRAGFTDVTAIDEHGPACETLRRNKAAGVEHVRDWQVLEDDIRRVDFKPYTGVDLISGGPPCQPFSYGGNRYGRDDSREMFPEFIRAVREVKPKAFVFENVRQIRDLFKFSRYRPAPDGKHTIEDDFANTGGENPDGSSSGEGGGGGRRKKSQGGRAGDIYALFADVGNTPAEEVGGFSDPIVKWVSVRDGSRSTDFLEDRAAEFLPQANTIQANADFRVFTDMIARWQKFYSHTPAALPVVESVVKEWFQQQLIETVLGALALRKSGNWSEQEVEKLWQADALTSAVLPRYHIDQQIKRALGSKVGTLKEKDAA